MFLLSGCAVQIVCLFLWSRQKDKGRGTKESGVQSLIGCVFVSPEWHRREDLIPINADGLMVQLTVNIVNIVFVMMMIMMTMKTMMTMELIVKPGDHEHVLLFQSWVTKHVR